jgi:hypothetical protein
MTTLHPLDFNPAERIQFIITPDAAVSSKVTVTHNGLNPNPIMYTVCAI